MLRIRVDKVCKIFFTAKVTFAVKKIKKRLRHCITQERSRIGCVVYGYLKMSVKKYVIKSKKKCSLYVFT